MLWPLELPVKITFAILLALVLLATIGAGRLKWAPRKTFVIASLIAFIGFIPSCTVVMKFVDARRFGVFEYSSYHEVKDFRIERFLPPTARDITLEKTFMGHRAKYTITETELRKYLDGLWETYGSQSSISRSNLKDGEPGNREEIEMVFEGLNWPQINGSVQFHSPVESDGGGATYYFDPTSGVTYHRAAYW